MSPKVKRRLAAVMAAFLAIVLLLSLILSLISPALAAKTSDEIANEMYENELEANQYAQEAEELEVQAAAKRQEAQEAVDQKLLIDQAIVLVEEEVDEIRAEIQQLNLNIAAKQEELDAALAAEDRMTERYKTRLRAMEEGGSGSYWAVLFRATSLSDLLDQLNMIADISRADLMMQEKLAEARALVEQEQAELEQAREELNAKQTELEEKQAQLTELRTRLDELILQLVADNELLVLAQFAAEEQEALLREESLELLKAYNDALEKEMAAASANSSGTAGASGFLYPLPSGVGWVTDAYGWRWHPVAQAQRFHYGVDFAANQGTSIYATKSGTVVKATKEDVNGNCVMIQHTDGTASLYAHLSSFAVSYGDTVSQGSVIGYVGSTGWSTGPHLHFEIFINGSNVNPMEYVSIY